MTATVIDSLVIELGLDTKDLAAGNKKLADFFKSVTEGAGQSGKAVDESTKKQTDGVVKLRNELVALLAVFTAGRGIKEFVSDMTSSNAALGRFADMLGLTTREVAQWRAGASLLGVNAGDIDASFKSLTTEIQRFSLTGESSTLPWFRMLGIQFADVNGKAKDAGEIFLELADRVHGMDKARATTILEQMGISTGMIQVIEQGRGAVQQLLGSQKAYADALAADAPAAQARLKAWNDLKNTLTGLAVQILTAVTPALVAITKALGGFFKDHPDLGKAIIVGLTIAIGALSVAVGVGLVASLAAATAAAAPVLLVIGLVAAAVASVVGEVALATSGFKGWGDTLKTFANIASGGILGLIFPSITAPSEGPSARPSGSNADSAIDAVLRHEDANLSGRVTVDSGGITKYGISSKANPGVDVANLTVDQARDIYRKKYWAPLAAQKGFSGLSASLQQDALDAAVNQGTGNAVAWLRASNGDQRIFDQLRDQQYERLAAANPAKYAQYLKGWENRVGGAPRGGNQSTSTSTSSSTTHIGTLVVNSSASNAAGIADDIRKELVARNALVQQVQSGPS